MHAQGYLIPDSGASGTRQGCVVEQQPKLALQPTALLHWATNHVIAVWWTTAAWWTTVDDASHVNQSAVIANDVGPS